MNATLLADLKIIEPNIQTLHDSVAGSHRLNLDVESGQKAEFEMLREMWAHSGLCFSFRLIFPICKAIVYIRKI